MRREPVGKKSVAWERGRSYEIGYTLRSLTSKLCMCEYTLIMQDLPRRIIDLVEHPAPIGQIPKFQLLCDRDFG
jgi:hypothetical protein